ncbi:2'-5'-oligoadenylate synthase 1-like [Ptychodera flava]|uniref:2'-5'-oligoadenylate synthase 1-like n=1 Tax=Ptychodera flava TaxID=63121 RepID=UPI003969F800
MAWQRQREQDFLHQSPYTLEQWVVSNLQPTEAFNQCSKDVVDRLINFLQHNTPYSVNRVIKSGSFGKGTQIKGHADLDCVMILNDLRNVEGVKRRLRGILQDLARLLRQSNWATTIDIEKTTRFAVQFDVTVTGYEKLSVDLLPTFDLFGQTPSLGMKEHVFSRMMTSVKGDDPQYYSAAASELQVEFIRKQPAKVKNLIRLVKHWRKSVVLPQARGGMYPTSYPMELVTIHVWEKSGRPHDFNMAVAFKAVLNQMANYHALNVVWYEHYTKPTADQAMRYMDRPILLDPANPTNNVIRASSPGTWDHVARIAGDSMRKPLLQIVHISPTLR